MSYRKAIGLAIFTAAIGCAGGSSPGGLNAERTFTVALTSAEEVPTPRPTTASGVAQVIIYPSEIEFHLTAQNITGITMAHIHSGAVGVAGPIVVPLFVPGSATGSISGSFARGTLDAGSLPGSVTVESLKALLLSGNAYVNVHTTANPAGEIRGQIR